MSSGMKPFLWRYLVALDQQLNVLISIFPYFKRKGFGYPDETISSVVGKRYYHHNDRSLFIKWVYILINKIDPGHFKRGIEYDEGL